MSSGRNYTPKDYLALGVALLLAFGVWFIHNLSLDYSGLVQRNVAARCYLHGHSNVSHNAVDIAVRCKMSGFGLLSYKMGRKHKTLTVDISSEDMKYYRDDLFFMTKDELSRYFHEFFGDKSTLEYFVTDTIFFRFPVEDYKKVPVRCVSSITFSPQYLPGGELRLSPDSVFVYGNRDLIDGILSVSTEVVGFQNVSSSLVGEVALERIPGVRVSDEKVRYELAVFRYVEYEFETEVNPVNLPANVSAQVFPASATVKLKAVFPGPDDFPGVNVFVDFNEYDRSVNGKCLGRVEGLPAEVLDCVLEPDVFDLVILEKE